jgi:type III secretion protein V
MAGNALGGRFVRRYSDIALAGLVVGIIAMMIIPLPTRVLDVLLATNISLAVILLLVAIYVTEPIRIATFPTLLLITTLFRLGLNVSSTRLILLQADAGEVIRSFGQFVVSGNLVVGAIVFLILTLIQFVVIAKGSERVAEVAARFTLDAMPGKQMAIDAELRSGTIDSSEARRRRRGLERESQLYGSMDGAMKFVKGDAIAGIVITLVNIVGGLIVGVYQMGMSGAEAAEVYSLLTIGDGLVSQIPALVISTSAGLVVTRVASEDETSHLGQDIAGQLLGQPKAIAIAAALMLGLALVPGLPWFPFLVLGLLCAVVAHALLRRGQRLQAGLRRGAPWKGRGDWAEPGPQDGGLLGLFDSPRAEPGLEEGPRELVEAVALEVSADLASWVDPAQGELGRAFAEERLPGLRATLFQELGLLVPPIRVRVSDGGLPPGGLPPGGLPPGGLPPGGLPPGGLPPGGLPPGGLPPGGLPPGSYRIRFKEVPLGEGSPPEGALLALASKAYLERRGVAAEEAGLAGLGHRSSWLAKDQRDEASALGVPVLEGPEILAAHLEALLRRHGHELLGIQETRALLDALETTHPHLVEELVPKPVTVPLLAEVLRRLAEEGINLRHLADLLPVLASWLKTEKDPVLLTEYCRMALRRQITHQFSSSGGSLSAVVLDSEIERVVSEAIQRSEAGSYLALEPELGREILDAARAVLGPALDSGAPAVVLTSMEIRRFVKKLLEVELPDVTVLSYQELSPDLEILPAGRLALG